ncbi:MAG: hypothetical protein MI922_04395 [Bacteroidales bacterium]|nr:hypothetical protein [Bacteroidales bacterium]
MKIKHIISLIVPTIIIISSCDNAFYDMADWHEKRDYGKLPQIKDFRNYVLRANNVDTLPLEIAFPPGAKSDLVKAELSVTDGKFLPDNEKSVSLSQKFKKPNNDSTYLRAFLVTSNSEGFHQLTIDIPDVYKRTYAIMYNKSLPSRVSVSRNKIAVKNDKIDVVELSAKLSSNPGLAHKGTNISFVVADSLHSDNEQYFTNYQSVNSSGVATIHFSPGYLNGYLGLLPVVAYTFNENKELISDTTHIELVEAK